MAVNTGGGRRIGAVKRPHGLSVVLRSTRRVPDGAVVEVRMGDGRIVAGQARWIERDVLRVFLPEGAK